MPNHITNQLSVCDDDPQHTQLVKIAEYLQADGSFLGSVDFNKIIPMPKSLDIEAGSRGDRSLKIYKEFVAASTIISTAALLGRITKEEEQRRIRQLVKRFDTRTKDDPGIFDLGRQYYQNIQNYGCPTWYEWSTKNWGTKWNAYDCIPLEEHPQALIFSTAWDGIPTLIQKLSRKFPEMRISYQWADENLGHSVGQIIFQDGAVKDECIPNDGSREAYEMGAGIREIKLADWGLVLSEDKSTYRYYDEEDIPKKTTTQKKTNVTKKKPKSKER